MHSSRTTVPLRRVLARAALVAALMAPLSVRAQEEPPAYKEVITEAVRDYEAGRYPEARALFAQAHQIYPNARSLRGMGMVEFELRNYLESVARLEQALASNVKPLDARLRAETVRLLERARRYIATVQLTVEPSHAQVVVDGAPAQRATDGSLRLSLGDHVIEASAAGYEARRRSVHAKGGEQIPVTLSLERAADAPQPAPIASLPPPAWAGSSASATAPSVGQAERLPAVEAKRTQIYGGPRVGAGGELIVDSFGTDMAATPGFQIGASYALVRHFALGGELRFSWYKSSGYEGDRAFLFDAVLKPRFVWPFERIPLELSLGVPLGLTASKSVPVGPSSSPLEARPGFTIGAGAATTYFFSRYIGASLELMWLMHLFGADSSWLSTDKVRFNQASFALSVVFGL